MRLVKIILMFVLVSSLHSRSIFGQQIIAHRGASHRAPENTIAAVNLGYALGANAVEIDIHLSKDNRIMVIHDKDTKRTAGGKNLIVKETNASLLRKLDVGRLKNEQYKGEKIPFLEEVLAVVPQGKTLVIEIKSDEKILPYLQKIIKESGKQHQLVIISFGKAVIVKAKQLMPDIPAFWLLHNYNKYSLDEAIKIAKDNNLNGLDVNFKLVNTDFMNKAAAAELEVYAYTVNDAEIARQLSAMNVKGITTDRPKWLREQLTQ